MINQTESYNIAIYARESRDDNFENYETIENQVGLLKEFVRKNMLGEVIKVYEDDNVSGTMFDRDGLRRLENDILEKKINAIVLKDLSRLGRNNAKTLLFLDFLEEQKVRVITADFRYDSLKDNETVGIETWANERYCRDLSRKIRAALRYKIEKGEHIGKAPYGYSKSELEKNKLIINKLEAEVVKSIFEMYCDGLGYLCIARILNSRGIDPPSKQSSPDNKWNSVAVGRILANRVYVGDTVQGTSEKLNFKSKKTRKLPREEWIITNNTHEPIIEHELFENARRIKDSKSAFSGTHKDNIHVLKGLLFCKECGSHMYSRVRKGSVGYVCGNYFKNGSAVCQSHHVNENIICNSIRDYLIKLLNNDDIRKCCKNELKKKFSENKQGTNDLKCLKAEKNRIKTKQETAYKDRLEGLISAELFNKINLDFQKLIENYDNKIQKLKDAEYSEDLELLINNYADRLKKSSVNRADCTMSIERITVAKSHHQDTLEIQVQLK